MTKLDYSRRRRSMSPPPPNDTEPDVHGGPIPDDGRILSLSTAQTIKAVAFLILVTLLSFLSVAFIGKLIGSNQATYWLIELIFALLCGGAGALVGGSADVRSTLNIPGSPVHARLGGAIAMVIVGFSVAYLGRPPDQGEQFYTVEFQNVPQTKSVDNVQYKVYVGAVANDSSSITKKGNLVTITVPSAANQYRASLAIFTGDSDSAKIFGRCLLTFETSNGREAITRELVPESDKRFRIYLPDKYIESVVHESIRGGRAVENDSCAEGVTTTTRGERKLFSGYFILVPAGWLSHGIHINMPPYAVMATVVGDDIPPEPNASPGGGISSQHPAQPAISAATPRPTARTPDSALPAAPPVKAEAVSAPTVTGVSGLSESSGIKPPSSIPATPVLSSAPPATQSLEAQVDAYIHGQNQDRTQLYQYWDQVAAYVAQGFRAADSSGSPSTARYINLITNALNTIDNGKYLAPTLRPNSDQSSKPSRLKDPIPGFEPDDYKKVVSLLCSIDTNSRTASQRLLRTFPADSFFQPLQTLQKQTGCDLLFVSESAIYYYYNRIVEYDGTWILDATSLDWLTDNYKTGGGWVTLATTKDPSHDVFGALLDFAYGLDFWDRTNSTASQTNSVPYFQSMLKMLGSSKGIYPSNPAHIAIALRAVNSPTVSSKTMDSATPFKASVLQPVGGNYIADAADNIALFALPEMSSKTVGNLSSHSSVRIYMRADSWDLVQAGPQIGWAQRTVTSVGN